jgi:hypothetical protein
MKIILALLLLVFSCVSYGQKTKNFPVYEINKISYFPSKDSKEYTDHAVSMRFEHTTPMSGKLINLESPDTLHVTLETMMPDVNMGDGGIMKGFMGKFNHKEFAMISFAIVGGQLKAICMSDGNWVMIYYIYYRINTDT